LGKSGHFCSKFQPTLGDLFGVTTSLVNFWKSSFPKLKLELSRKDPRHEWR
jgi:hypothetical protein